MKKMQQGFTLIELMIVIAIIGILAAIAIPSYQDYIRRSQASEIAAAANAPRVSVNEYFVANGRMPSTTTLGGLVQSLNPTGQFVSWVTFNYVDASSVNFVARGTVQGNTSVGLRVSAVGNTATGNIQWRCTGLAGIEYLPATCRGQ